MKSINVILTTTAILAVAAVTIQSQQNVAAFNDKNNDFVSNTHNHLRIGGEGPEGIQSSSGSVYNDENTHSSTNYNSEREDTEKDNTFEKPNKKD